jgi:hypothetical protein
MSICAIEDVLITQGRNLLVAVIVRFSFAFGITSIVIVGVSIIALLPILKPPVAASDAGVMLT